MCASVQTAHSELCRTRAVTDPRKRVRKGPLPCVGSHDKVATDLLSLRHDCVAGIAALADGFNLPLFGDVVEVAAGKTRQALPSQIVLGLELVPRHMERRSDGCIPIDGDLTTCNRVNLA